MDESATRWRLPWGVLLTLGLLTAVLLTVPGLRLPSEAREIVPWRILAALAAFLVLRSQQGYLWGVAAALLVALHPLNARWNDPMPEALRAQSMELLVLWGVVVGCGLAFQPTFAWLSWLAITMVLVIAGALAWPAWPPTGLVCGLLVFLGLLSAAILASLRIRARPNSPALTNVIVAGVLGMAAPVGMLVLAPGSAMLTSDPPLQWPRGSYGELESLTWEKLYSQATEPDHWMWGSGFYGKELGLWPWPIGWVVISLMAQGFFLAVWRGWGELSKPQPPVGWVLVLYTLIHLGCDSLNWRVALQTHFLQLAMLSVILTVFGVAEVVRSIGAGLVLPPPEERHPN